MSNGENKKKLKAVKTQKKMKPVKTQNVKTVKGKSLNSQNASKVRDMWIWIYGFRSIGTQGLRDIEIK